MSTLTLILGMLGLFALLLFVGLLGAIGSVEMLLWLGLEVAWVVGWLMRRTRSTTT
jgi:hypothetical protein